MTDFSDTLTAIETALSDALSAIITHLPNLLAALLVLGASWLIARFVRNLITRVGKRFNALLERLFKSGTLSQARLSAGARSIIAEIAFWAILFVGITIAAQTAGFSGLSSWFDQLVRHIPNLLIGAALIFVGYFASIVAGEYVGTLVKTASPGRSALISKLVQAVIFITALIIGLDQIGINVTFLVALFAVSVGAVFIGFSIAFGLGAKDFVANIIGARSARRALFTGQHIRYGSLEGEILEITPTHVTVETPEGKALLPAHILSSDIVTIISAPTEKDVAHGG